jgi:hypothetical protein
MHLHKGPHRPHHLHTPPSWVPEGSWYFIAVNAVVHDGIGLCDPHVSARILDSTAFLHRTGKWSCRLLLIMPDHLQGIFSFPRKPGLTTSMILWKEHLAEGLGISWQPGFFDHRLREPKQVSEKTDQILHHPVRSGLCRTWQEWPHVFRPQFSQAEGRGGTGSQSGTAES